MRNAFLAGASAVALVLGGCSMFQSGGDHQAQSTNAQPVPAYSGSSQAPSQASKTQGQTAQHDTTTDQMGSTSNRPMSGRSVTTHGSASNMNPDDVKQAQQKLKDDGDYKGQVDGKFGSQTAQAVKQFQKKNGLHQTGRLDSGTLGKLGVGTTGAGSSTPPAASTDSGMSTVPGAASTSGTTVPPAAKPNPGTATPPATTPGGSL